MQIVSYFCSSLSLCGLIINFAGIYVTVMIIQSKYFSHGNLLLLLACLSYLTVLLVFDLNVISTRPSQT